VLIANSDSLDPFSGADPAIDTRSVFSWSYRALSDEAARLFRLLGVPAGPDITVAAAASLAAQPRPRVAHLLDELTNAHLIAQHRAGRYAFHDLLRTDAMELAVGDSDERDSVLHRLLDHYLQSAVVGATLIRSDREPLPCRPAERRCPTRGAHRRCRRFPAFLDTITRLEIYRTS